MLGADSQVGEGAVVEGSVLGRRCIVGARAVVTGSYLWDGSVVKAGARVDRAVVCSDAIVGEGAVISRGCVVSFNVRVEDGKVVVPFTRLTTADPYENVENRSWGGSSEEGGIVDEDAAPFAAPKRPSWKDGDAATASPAVAGGTKTYREYDLNEEMDNDDVARQADSAPEWVHAALEAAPNVWKQDAQLVMTSMGTEELDRARALREWRLPDARQDAEAEDDDSFEVVVRSLVDRVVTNANADDVAFNDSVAQELRALRASRRDCSFTDLVSAFVGLGLRDATESKQAMLARLSLLVPVLREFNPFKEGTQDAAVMIGLIQIVELVCLCGAPAAVAAYATLGQHHNDLRECLDDNEVPVTPAAKGYFAFCLKLLCDEGVVDLSAVESWRETRFEMHAAGNELGGLFADAKFVQVLDMLVTSLRENDDEDEEEE